MTPPTSLRADEFPERSRRLVAAAAERALIFDGAMGTQIFALDLPAEAFGEAPDCPEILNLTRPEAIAGIHERYFAAGADIVETNTFGGSGVTLGEFGLGARAVAINRAAAALAREAAAAAEAADPSKPRFVSGSVGPGTKLPSLGHIGFAELSEGLTDQVEGLALGGADLIQIETCQDPLQIKAALIGARRAFEKTGIRLPVLVTVTVETMGSLLVGSDIGAVYTILEPYAEIWALGLNCATGPSLMGPHLRALTQLTDRPLGLIPNAGLPENRGGKEVYPLGPEDFARETASYVRELGLAFAGGCCGTEPAHIEALNRALAGHAPPRRAARYEPSAASLFGATTLAQEPPPLLVGERLNANGSKKFRRLLKKEDYDAMVAMARDQMKGGAHMLDVCVAYVGRDEARDMRELITRLRGQSTLPIVVDSTEAEVVAVALELIPGRAVVNSINLEDGEAKARQVLELCRTHGAAVIALTIDEEGQAYTAERKVAIAERIFKLALEHGLRPADVIFDALTFTLGTGEEQYRRVGIETLDGIRGIKERCPGALTILGLSNCSFGLNPAARQVLNSVFLQEALEAGLDQAIVHASKILPIFRIGEAELAACRDLIFDDRSRDDPLMRLLKLFADRKATGGVQEEAPKTVEERLTKRIIDGDKTGLEPDLDLALERYEPLVIINTFLLDGMKVVGELFGAGKMQLPFVLQSAEVMKAAVKFLEPHMDRLEGQSRGKVVLATVKGDVHDIGKNLVDIILSNNGFKVFNLGIKQPIERIIQAAQEEDAQVIGMSGLLVKSTVVMKDNLVELNNRGLTSVPIILGGAALTRSYVEDDLRALYRGSVAYAPDAFEGLRLVTRVCEGGSLVEESSSDGAQAGAARRSPSSTAKVAVASGPRRAALAEIEPPSPPFWGGRAVHAPFREPGELLYWINKRALFRGQWQFRRGAKSRDEQRAFEAETVEPIYAKVSAEALERGLITPKVAYGYFPCRSEGDALIIYQDPEGREERCRLAFPRQAPGRKDLCLADYLRSDRIDVVGFSAVTVGPKASAFTQELFAADDYSRYLYFHGLSVEAAEGLAEYWHRVMRRELGIDGGESAEPAELFAQRYRGARYSFGYPACPELEHQRAVFDLIPAAEIGLSLTEECQLVPEQSTTALVIHHPEARYFMV